MGRLLVTVTLISLVSALPTAAWEMKEYQADWDYGTELPHEFLLQYYYFIPCPTHSWFWGVSGWEPGSQIGVYFTLGDISMGGFSTWADYYLPRLYGFSYLDFAGYGAIYPGLYTVEFEIRCADDDGCPVGVPIWNSGPVESAYGWNYISISPCLEIEECCIDWHCYPDPRSRILILATHIGTDCSYPSWGMDNVSCPVESGCDMHDRGCYTAHYPRPFSSHYASMHSGYYGVDFEYCPPQYFADGGDTSEMHWEFGYVELAWRLYIEGFFHDVEPATWGSIKSMYR